jgi:chromosomal replication initiation ATPase DnaA
VRQLVLDLPVEPRFGPDDFLVSPSNEAAYALVERWPDWPSPLLHLHGPPGSGKSHLSAIWAHRAGATPVEARKITPEWVGAWPGAPALAIENLEGDGVDEKALFHLLNMARERHLTVLLTSATPLENCGIETPDLLSRLRLAPSVELGPPDDALLRAVLVKLFLDRQLVVDTAVIEYLAQRIERSLARAVDVVARIDREALSRGRRVTRPMAAALVGLGDGDED